MLLVYILNDIANFEATLLQILKLKKLKLTEYLKNYLYHRNASKGEAAMKTILEEVPDKSDKVFNIYILLVHRISWKNPI